MTNNISKFWNWFFYTCFAAIIGAMFGGLAGSANDASNTVAIGAFIAGFIPAILSCWFLFLYMISEISSSVRGK